MKNSPNFIKIETLGANLLLGATILALILSNSPLNDFYEKFFTNPIFIHSGAFELKTNLKFIINEVLMTIFFLVVGLEIKYELLQGSLNSFTKALLPVIAAVGGMVVPALIYVAFNYDDVFNLRGWAIPTATDIAFALGVLSLLGSRVAPSLKAFLTALAIIDDLAAIIIIAFFYTDHLSFLFLGLSLISIGFLLILNLKEINNLIPYCVIGILLWSSLFFAGVHPTLAGVALALSVPLYKAENKTQSPLRRLLHLLHPLVALGILPLFAFANAGISLFNLSLETLHLSIVIGIFLSLFLGKQLGIFSACWLAVRLRIAQLPEQVQWIELYAIAIICGIGFTISLFIGALAFGETNISHINSVKIGVLSGSLFSGITGYLLLFLTKRKYRAN